jgi:uncharacterized protein (DUF58 family)
MTELAETGPLQRYRHKARQRWKHWINRRIPPAKSVTLDQKRIFIFPSRAGLFFMACLLVMLVAAINYQNNMSFALVFLLANMFVIAVLHTYANLAGLTIRAVRARPVFAGQTAEFELLLSREGRRQHYAIQLQWPGAEPEIVNLAGSTEATVKQFLETRHRGWHNPGRLLVETVFPLGLLRAWTWVDLEIRSLVYPRPLASGPLPGVATDRPDGSAVPIPGMDDFYGLRDYQSGDPLKQVYWKSVAKGQPLQTKQYTAYADRSVSLDWTLFEGLPVEQRLGHLCHWVLEFDRNNEEYGLRLPGVTLAPNCGEQHKLEVLRRLALFGLNDEG